MNHGNVSISLVTKLYTELADWWPTLSGPDEYEDEAAFFIRCRPGGVALFVPDEVRETFEPSTGHGGSDLEGRSVRYVQWTTDPDPSDTTIQVDFGILLREGDGEVRVVHERQLHGLFARSVWTRTLRSVGFTPSVVSDEVLRDMFMCRRKD